MKVVAGIASGSVSIISEAIHSFLDLLAAIIAFFAVKFSDKPPDKKHPYGHGKYENVSGVIEAVLIFIASFWIIYEAIKKIQHNDPVEKLGIGVIVMLVSAVVNIIVSRKLYKTAKEEDSVALEADALHLKTDVYTSLGVGVGLLLIWITNWQILDPFIAIIVALFILRESYRLLKTAFNPLLDTQLSDEEINIIKNSIQKFSSVNMSFHQLRTRKAGFYKYIDLHLDVPESLSVKEAHDTCDKIEEDINHQIKNSEVSIHIEPCQKDD